jgi:hypothetical protein
MSMANGSVRVLRTQTRPDRQYLHSTQINKRPAILHTAVNRYLVPTDMEANKVLETRHTKASKRLARPHMAGRQYLGRRLKAGAEAN